MFIPDDVALRLAQFERDALAYRARELGGHWVDAACSADDLVMAIETGETELAIQFMKEIAYHWRLAAGVYGVF